MILGLGETMKALTKTLEQFANEWREHNPRASNLIAAANWDLYQGPHGDGEYPGFQSAVREISNALDNVGDLWVDVEFGGWCEREPTWHHDCSENDCVDSCGDDGQWPEFWAHVDRSDVLRAIVGKELVAYVR